MHRIRRAISKKISKYVENNIFYELELPSKHEQSSIGKQPALLWRVNDEPTKTELERTLPNLEFKDEFVRSIRFHPSSVKSQLLIEFQLEPQKFVEELLSTHQLPDTKQNFKQMHMVFDYSSPNIAKPFHVGHLRSTIIGNALANVHQYLGYRVTKLNYLGDWGTQFGLLQVGVEMLGLTEEQVKANPIESLYNAYVAANAAAESDASLLEKARQYFTQLELGTDKESERKWQMYRDYTVKDLSKIYARLGVHFDLYEWESQYSQNQIGDIIRKLDEKSLLFNEDDGRKVVKMGDRRVPIIKSDGSTLYLARDIAALVDRFNRFRFERMFYVVENGQADHFHACFKTTSALCPDDIPEQKLKHVKFGRIHGMSTRKGNVVLLQDVLDEARDIMWNKQKQSQTTKVDINTEEKGKKDVADVLGITAVIVNDLKQRRQRDYDFNWNKALQVNGDTGIKLQYTHCRLHNLLVKNSDIDINDVLPLYENLNEPEAQDLLFEIGRFDQIIWHAKEQLEACILVNYLFNLCNTTSRALKRLNIKNDPSYQIKQQRILLFLTAKETLKEGMKALGLRPLTQM